MKPFLCVICKNLIEISSNNQTCIKCNIDYYKLSSYIKNFDYVFYFNATPTNTPTLFFVNSKNNEIIFYYNDLRFRIILKFSTIQEFISIVLKKINDINNI